ncbi:MAG: alternative ribosome rescue aminoacyl-tRNA hydrolase ArfB [Pirellulaceae bacterium]|jgi:ribosome-associated protein|nr:alternative ribosome rescue aminoacyl-tRNA hydrolase ArfB [Pirellulaceae bacterium]MDP6554555.1 alternative ribosome rescue aminoacyl-tRNA hydrolase ArfB [Pirellulaceae bacterium]MDP6722908.1 alternative ribosome rescue aminoacyl-tRNA hydrolase ArfB [Pirellulaceae bacterium]
MLVVNHRIAVPLKEFNFTYSRSSGPGGQNVNKVNTKVTLHWSVSSSSSVPEDVRGRFVEKFRRRINNKGQLVVVSQRFRDQGRNVGDCLAKLREMLSSVAIAPKARKATRPSRASRERRLQAKQRTSDKKRGRGRVTRDD